MIYKDSDALHVNLSNLQERTYAYSVKQITDYKSI